MDLILHEFPYLLVDQHLLLFPSLVFEIECGFCQFLVGLGEPVLTQVLQKLVLLIPAVGDDLTDKALVKWVDTEQERLDVLLSSIKLVNGVDEQLDIVDSVDHLILCGQPYFLGIRILLKFVVLHHIVSQVLQVDQVRQVQLNGLLFSLRILVSRQVMVLQQDLESLPVLMDQ